MAGRYLLDRNFVIDLLENGQGSKDFIAKGGEFFTCEIVLGELYYGAYKSTQQKKNIKRVEQYAASVPAINGTNETAHHYGSIKADLIQRGKPIPENDIWIAAIAKQYELTVVTRDKHFSSISELEAATY